MILKIEIINLRNKKIIFKKKKKILNKKNNENFYLKKIPYKKFLFYFFSFNKKQKIFKEIIFCLKTRNFIIKEKKIKINQKEKNCIDGVSDCREIIDYHVYWQICDKLVEKTYLIIVTQKKNFKEFFLYKNFFVFFLLILRKKMNLSWFLYLSKIYVRNVSLHLIRLLLLVLILKIKI